MAWLSRTTYSSIDRSPSQTDLNSWGFDLRTWGGNVDAGGNELTNCAKVHGAAATGILTLPDAVAFPEIVVTLANGANQDINIGNASHIRIEGPTAAFSLGGFTGGTSGRMLWVFNNSAAQIMTVTYRDVGSVSANRIYIPTGANFVAIHAFSAAMFWWSSAISQWVLFAPALT